MHRTLITIPHEFLGIPIFGFGWLFAAVLIGGIAYAIAAQRNPKWKKELSSQLVGWFIVLVVVAFVVPNIELRDVHGNPVGLALRGYGFFLMTAVVSAVALAIYRARRVGINEEIVFALAPWLVVGGIVGARLFYVAMYPQQFFAGPQGQSIPVSQVIRSILSFTNGGIVVYGAMIGGLVAGGMFVWRHSLSYLKLGDIVAPALFLGVALGRIGCLMNGCCWGGRCDANWASLEFPIGSPVYDAQLESGELVGLTLSSALDETGVSEITAVAPGSLAEQAGFKVGETVFLHRVPPAKEEVEPGTLPDDPSQTRLEAVSKQHRILWTPKELPARALPVWAAQPISAIDSFLICAVLLTIADRIKRWPGLLLCVGFGLYAVVRFAEEVVRVDEPGRFGTSLSIGQWVSVVSIIGFGLLAVWVLKHPEETSNPPPPEAA